MLVQLMQHRLPFLLLIFISYLLEYVISANVAKSKGASVHSGKFPSLPLSPGPSLTVNIHQRGRGARSAECPPGVSRSTVKPEKAPQRQIYWARQIRMKSVFQAGYKCFERTASIFPDIRERPSWISAWMR